MCTSPINAKGRITSIASGGISEVMRAGLEEQYWGQLEKGGFPLNSLTVVVHEGEKGLYTRRATVSRTTGGLSARRHL